MVSFGAVPGRSCVPASTEGSMLKDACRWQSFNCGGISFNPYPTHIQYGLFVSEQCGNVDAALTQSCKQEQQMNAAGQGCTRAARGAHSHP
jgi:hypothetical protein